MKSNFTKVCSLPEHEYIFSSTGEIREAYPAIITRKRNNGKMELGLALISISQCILYYFESDKIVQLHRAMRILDSFNVVSDSTLANCFAIASRKFSNRTGAIIDHLERKGVDVMGIQSDVFAQEMDKREFNRIMKVITDLNIEVESAELEEELKIRYIPKTRFSKKLTAAVG